LAWPLMWPGRSRTHILDTGGANGCSDVPALIIHDHAFRSACLVYDASAL